MLHPEDQQNAAEQKLAAITGIETLGGGAKVSDPNAILPPQPPSTTLPTPHPALQPDTPEPVSKVLAAWIRVLSALL